MCVVADFAEAGLRRALGDEGEVDFQLGPAVGFQGQESLDDVERVLLWVVRPRSGEHSFGGALHHELGGERQQFGARGENVPEGADDEAGLLRDGAHRDGGDAAVEDHLPDRFRELGLPSGEVDAP